MTEVNFKKWFLQESPLAYFGQQFPYPATPGLETGEDTPNSQTGIFNEKDRVVITHPKTAITLEKILGQHHWNFNILMIEDNVGKFSHQRKDHRAKYLKIVYKWLMANNIPIAGRITYAKNGSSGDPMTPWMMLHTMGHAIVGRDETWIIQMLKNLNPDGKSTVFLKSHLKFKSVENMNNVNVKSKLGHNLWSELVYELFAEYMWNGTIRLKQNDKDVFETMEKIKAIFKNCLERSVGKIIVDHFY